MSATEDLELLAEKADALARQFAEPPVLVAVRGMLNDAGVVRARRVLEDALAIFENAQAAKRDADQAERDARATLDKAVDVAAWDLDGRFVTQGNKTLLDGEKAMTADERKQWKAREALTMPEVRAAADRLRAAEHETAVARDQLVAADKRLSAARADLDAAVATLQALTLALPARKAN